MAATLLALSVIGATFPVALVIANMILDTLILAILAAALMIAVGINTTR